jgi:hypothetical protein
MEDFDWFGMVWFNKIRCGSIDPGYLPYLTYLRLLREYAITTTCAARLSTHPLRLPSLPSSSARGEIP